MSDVADVLGLEKTNAVDSKAMDPHMVAMTAVSKRGGTRKGRAKKSQPKPPGMSREVYALLDNRNSNNLPPIVATKTPTIIKGRKTVLGGASKKPCARWVWVPFENSARNDDLKLMHWVKEGVEYPDYPYARYNVKIPHVSYTSEQYTLYSDRPDWTRGDTDKLVAICRRFNLCWPVIADRAQTQLSTPRPIEQLQHRYYDIASRLRSVATAGGAGATPAPFIPGLGTFNVQYEEQRRKQMHKLFLKSKDGEQEEAVLRTELKQAEANIKKLRQNKDLYKIGSEMAVLTVIQGVQNGNAAKGYPFLQSQRLASAMQPLQPVSKALLSKVKQILAELHVPEKLMPTKAVCDLYDMLLFDILTMFILQKIATRKEETELLSMKYTKPQGQGSSQMSSLYSAPSSSSIGATMSELSTSHKKRKSGGSGVLSSKIQRMKK